MQQRNSRLKFGLHVAALESLNPHETALVVLDPHYALRTIPGRRAVLGKERSVLQILLVHDDGRAGCALETHHTVPCHVLGTSISRRTN